jgi:methylthioxylose transferase
MAGLAVVLYLFTPAKIFFFPLLNTVTPAVVFGCACLIVRWLNSGRATYAGLVGAAIYGLILFEPAALVTGLLFAVLVVRALLNGRITPGAAVRHIAIGIVAFAATYAAMRAWFGFDLISAFRHVSADATNFNVLANRPYGLWARQNLWDFAFGVGLCQIVLFAAAFGDGLMRARVRAQWALSIVLLCSAAVGMVGAADAVGINRGEVIRLWIFLACVWQIPAAYVCRRLDSRTAFIILMMTTLLEDVLGSSMIAFIAP